MIKVRWANKKDKDHVALLMIEASGGICEYLLSDNNTPIPNHKLLAFEVSRNDSPISVNNCLVIQVDNSIAGLLCCYHIDKFISQRNLIRNSMKRSALWDFYSITPRSNSLYIDTICIDNAYRGRGLGKFILSQVIKFLEKTNYENISLYVWSDNQVALSLYRTVGFKVIDSRCSAEETFPIKQDRLLMNISSIEFRKYFEKDWDVPLNM